MFGLKARNVRAWAGASLRAEAQVSDPPHPAPCMGATGGKSSHRMVPAFEAEGLAHTSPVAKPWESRNRLSACRPTACYHLSSLRDEPETWFDLLKRRTDRARNRARVNNQPLLAGPR